MKFIAGIDPGLATGIAVVDVNSDYCEAFSRKNFSFSDVCSFLISKGEPIIIAADVADAPGTVKRIASNFGARLRCPKADISIDEKKSLTMDVHCSNAHERDAMAAALAAKKEFSALFRKIDAALESRNLPEIRYEVKELLVKGEAGNIEQAIKLLTETGKKKDARVITRIMGAKKIYELTREIENLRKAKQLLEEKAERLSKPEKMPVASDRSYKEMLSERLAEENEKLRKEIRELENLAESGEYEVLVSDLSSGIEGKIVILEGNTGMKALEARNPRAIVSTKKFDTPIPVIDMSKLDVRKIGKFTVARKKDIENALAEKPDGESFLKWLEKYREERKYA